MFVQQNDNDLLLSLLQDQNSFAISLAIESLMKNLSSKWFVFIDHLQHFKILYSSGLVKKERVALLMSQMLFYADWMEESVEWAVLAEQDFELTQRTLYHDSIITNIIQQFRQRKINGLEKDHQKQYLIQIEKIVNELIERSIQLGNIDKTLLLIGLMCDLEKWNFLKQLLLNMDLNDFEYFLDNVQQITKQIFNTEAVYKICLEIVKEKQINNSSILYKVFLLNKQIEELCELIIRLQQNDQITAYQILNQIQQQGDQYIILQLLSQLNLWMFQNKDKVLKILNGDLKANLNQNFQRNQKKILSFFLQERCKMWTSYDSVFANGFSSFLSLHLQGCNSIEFLTNQKIKEKIKSSTEWAKFSFVASLSKIFQNKADFLASLKDLELNQDGDYINGGQYFGQSLLSFGLPGSEEELEIYKKNLSNNSQQNGLKHGSILAIGLQYAFSNNPEIIEYLTQFLYGESSCLGEAAGYAIGLIKATKQEESFTENIINASRNNQHDRIARCMMIALSMSCLNQKNESMNLFEKMIKEKDATLRAGAVWVLSLGFINTSNNQVVKILLDIAAKDLSDEVQKQAIFGITFVLLSNHQRAFSLLKMLSKSFNESVWYTVALCLGVIGSIQYSSEIHTILVQLFTEKSSLVKQASGIALGFLHQKSHPGNSKETKEAFDLLVKEVDDKSNVKTFVFGCLIGLGLMFNGGQNSQIKLLNEKNQLLLKNFIGLSLSSDYLAVVDQNLELVQGTKIEFQQETQDNDYFEYKEQDSKKEEKKKVVLSMNKNQSKQEIATVQQEDNKKQETDFSLQNPRKLNTIDQGNVTVLIQNKKVINLEQKQLKNTGIIFVQNNNENNFQEPPKDFFYE